MDAAHETATAALVDNARNGCSEAVSALHALLSPSLQRQVAASVHCPAARQDVAQNAWLAFLRGLPGYRGRGSVGRWMRSIARNEIRQYFRGLSRHESRWDTRALDLVAAPSVAPDALLDLRAGLSRLPQRMKNVVLLRASGYSHDEIARMFGVVPGTSKSQCARGLRKLRMSG